MCWDGDTGEVNWIETYKGHRCMWGIKARPVPLGEEQPPDLHHSDDLSEDGRAFARRSRRCVWRRLLRGF